VPLGTVLKNKNKLDEMCQILDIVHKTSVPNDPKDNMKLTEDFFELVLVSHIIVAANTEYKQGMELEDLVDVTVKKYIKLSSQSAGQNTNDDFVCTYAHESNISHPLLLELQGPWVLLMRYVSRSEIPYCG
uniref:Uncharacterized protein n=1 Tax=Amphimedon queenslandica TaxID=400682 RepID=A0A1X7UYK2_AMPQE